MNEIVKALITLASEIKEQAGPVSLIFHAAGSQGDFETALYIFNDKSLFNATYFTEEELEKFNLIMPAIADGLNKLQKFDEQIAALDAAKYHSADYLKTVN
jgi:hypothetical protein